MGVGWPEYTLGDLCKFKYGQMPRKTDLCDDGYPVFSGYHIVGYATTYHYEEPEIIVVARGVGGTGDVKMSPPKCFLTNLSIVAKVVSSNVNKKFLYYRLAGPKLWELRTGSAQAQITIDRLQRYELRLPPLATQRKIAAILSAYDDLIENNLRRIKMLEEMAQNLYREWFVKFRFPGHQHARFIDSPLGQIPEGWEVVPLSSVVDFVKGRKPVETRNEPIAGDVRLLLIDALRGGEPQFTAPTRLVIAETRDTIMVMDGGSSCAVVQGFSGAVGSTLGRFRTTKPDRFSPHALYRFLEEKTDEFKSKNIGAAIPHANKDYILTQMIPLPPPTIVLGFHDYLEPIQSTIEILKAKNTTLRRTRDLLLPKLISGEVDVSELDFAVPVEAEA
jgi:type I restriction enzyme S subunit